MDDDSFTITLRLKPRVAAWVREVFGGHPKYTIEQRLAAWLEGIINRERAAYAAKERPTSGPVKGKAVTLRRHELEGGE